MMRCFLSAIMIVLMMLSVPACSSERKAPAPVKPDEPQQPIKAGGKAG